MDTESKLLTAEKEGLVFGLYNLIILTGQDLALIKNSKTEQDKASASQSHPGVLEPFFSAEFECFGGNEDAEHG